MANITLDKKKFLELLPQLKHDVPYELELINTLITQLPNQVRELYLRDMYYQHVHKGVYYKLTHDVFKNNIYYFGNLYEIKRFVKDNSFQERGDFWATIDIYTLNDIIEHDKLLCGYHVERVDNNG